MNQRKAKESLSGRLARYSAAAGALVLLGNSGVQAQVNYSGLQNIGLDLDTGYVELDLNDDSQMDFAIILGSTQNETIYNSINFRYISRYAAIQNLKTDSYKNSWITTLTTIRSATSGGTQTYIYQAPIVRRLDEGSDINAESNSWQYASSLSFQALLAMSYTFTATHTLVSISYKGFKGDFDEEGYIGVRFYIGDTTHYGWIRVATGAGMDSMTVIDWAWESVPGAGISAGEGIIDQVIGVTDNPPGADGILIYPNPAVDRVFIRSEVPSEIALMDMKGTVLKMERSAMYFECDVSDLQVGIYLVQISNREGTYRKRLLISH